MKKIFTILTTTALFTLISSQVKAQDTKEYVKSYMNFFGGSSLPLGDFGKADYYNNNAGFAKRGVVFGLEGAYYFYKNLAFVATVSYQDQGELSQNDVQTLANGYNTSLNKEATTVVSDNRYINANILGGPQYSFVYHKFTFDVRAVAGIVKSFSTPLFTAQYTNSTNTSTVALNQLSSSAKALAYGGGVGFRYNLGDSWDVNLRCNYIASPGIKISYSGTTTTNERMQTRQPITEIQTTLGIALHF